jgi:glucan endo-1,6-beta-glucosidase
MLAILTLGLLAQVSFAWLPHTKRSVSELHGRDLFAPDSSDKNLDRKWLDPNFKPIRGVNIGSLFILEYWMTSDFADGIGCTDLSEFDCVSKIGQDTANEKFQQHWHEWITTEDLDTIQSYGLNTIRIPLGYWFLESLVDSSEHFPRGGAEYLDQLVGNATERGFYIILDLHGAPGAQVQNVFTGQNNPNPGFYNDYNYDRAYKWLEWITSKIHTDERYFRVGMIELVNEPLRTIDDRTNSMRSVSIIIKVFVRC